MGVVDVYPKPWPAEKARVAARDEFCVTGCVAFAPIHDTSVTSRARDAPCQLYNPLEDYRYRHHSIASMHASRAALRLAV